MSVVIREKTVKMIIPKRLNKRIMKIDKHTTIYKHETKKLTDIL